MYYDITAVRTGRGKAVGHFAAGKKFRGRKDGMQLAMTEKLPSAGGPSRPSVGIDRDPKCRMAETILVEKF